MPAAGPYKNVEDYGAVGDGSTDDAPAIRRAAEDGKCGTVFFPARAPRRYAMHSAVPFELSDGYRDIKFLGDPGAKLIGAFPDAMLKRSPNSPVGRRLRGRMPRPREQPRRAARASWPTSFVGGKISNCKLSAWRAIETFNSSVHQGRGLLDHQERQPRQNGSIGIVAGNATTADTCDVSGYSHGIRHMNAGLIVSVAATK